LTENYLPLKGSPSYLSITNVYGYYYDLVGVFIFEHTRRPFMNKAKTLQIQERFYRCAYPHTFVQIEADKPKLFVIDGAEITERADI
jgi:hypothetical protein